MKNNMQIMSSCEVQEQLSKYLRYAKPTQRPLNHSVSKIFWHEFTQWANINGFTQREYERLRVDSY